jgi:ATP-dependent protease ClpP protease subunit
MLNLKAIHEQDNSVRINKEGNARAGYPYYYTNEFQVSYTPIRSGIFNIYLFGIIEDASQFVSAIEVLNTASENDAVYIHLSTPGGSIEAADTFIDAMRNCEGRVVVKASGGCHSAGTIILINSDEFILSENFHALLHNGSTGSGGKFSDWKAEVRHTEKYMESILRKTYEGFLTAEEIEQLIEGRDFWLDAQQFCERYENRNEMIRGKMAEVQADFMQAIGLGQPEEKAAKPKRKKAPKAENIEFIEA